MQNRQTHYTVLGVNQTASAEDIKRAYRRLVLIYHPDKVKNPSNIKEVYARFIAIQDAYEALRDTAKRRTYDTDLASMPYEQSETTAHMNSAVPNERHESPQQPVNTLPSLVQKTPFNPNLINEIKVAVMSRDEPRVAILCAEYKNMEISNDQRMEQQSTLNWLLRDCAEFKYNTIAMHLVGIGADVNQFGEIIKFQRPATLWIKEVLVVVECYFADMLAYWDNIQLLQMIGASKFNWDIYMVTDRTPLNTRNKMINIHGFSLDSDEYQTNFLSSNDKYNNALDLFHLDLAVRLQWLTTMCYKLVQANDKQTLEHIFSKYPDIPSFWGSRLVHDPDRTLNYVRVMDFDTVFPALGCEVPTAKNIIRPFMHLLDARPGCLSAYIYHAQYFLDRHMSLPVYLLLNRAFRVEHFAHFSTIFLAHKALTSELALDLNFYYQHKFKMLVSLIAGTGLGAVLLGAGAGKLYINGTSTENIIMILLGALFVLHLVTYIVILSLLALARLLSCGQIEVSGTIDEVFIRMYKTLLLKDLLTHGVRTTMQTADNASRITFSYNSQRMGMSNLVESKLELQLVEHSAPANRNTRTLNIV
jgi:hypothetical protein